MSLGGVSESEPAAWPPSLQRRLRLRHEHQPHPAPFGGPHAFPSTFAHRPHSIAGAGYAPVAWPDGAPPRPIRISFFYLPGVYDDIRGAMAALAQAVAGCLERATAPADAQQPSPPFTPTRVKGQAEQQPERARGFVWDCRDPDDFVPLQPTAAADPVADEINHELFARECAALAWPDQEMLRHERPLCVVDPGGVGRDDAGGVRLALITSDPFHDPPQRYAFTPISRKNSTFWAHFRVRCSGPMEKNLR
eukprot:scaffold1591_cov109-Isochrysis_galbana.AAC.4